MAKACRSAWTCSLLPTVCRFRSAGYRTAWRNTASGAETAVAAPASLPVCGCPGKRRRNVCHHRRTACAGKRVHRGQRGIIRSATRNDSRHRSPAIQHLTTEILAEEGQYQVLARWDTPRVVKGASFSLRLNVAAEDGSDRLVSSAGTPDTQYRFRG